MNKCEIKKLLRSRKEFEKELQRLHDDHYKYLNNMCVSPTEFKTDKKRHDWILQNAASLRSVEALEERAAKIIKKQLVIDQALNEMPYEEARVIIDHYVEGDSFVKIAMKNNYSEGGMRKRIEKVFEDLSKLVSVIESNQMQSLFPYSNVYKVVDGHLVKRNSNCVGSKSSRIGFKELKKEGWLPLKIISPPSKEAEYYGQIREEYNVTEDYIEVTYVVCE